MGRRVPGIIAAPPAAPSARPSPTPPSSFASAPWIKKPAPAANAPPPARRSSRPCDHHLPAYQSPTDGPNTIAATPTPTSGRKSRAYGVVAVGPSQHLLAPTISAGPTREPAIDRLVASA